MFFWEHSPSPRLIFYKALPEAPLGTELQHETELTDHNGKFCPIADRSSPV
ncbi:hypothetical protein CCP2SC5_1260001 [Azospirillaceae bacterium]